MSSDKPAPGRPAVQSPAEVSAALRRAQLRKEQVAAKKAEADLAVRSGALVARSEVEADARRAAAAVAGALQELPMRAALALQGRALAAAEIERVLRSEIERALHALADSEHLRGGEDG